MRKPNYSLRSVFFRSVFSKSVLSKSVFVKSVFRSVGVLNVLLQLGKRVTSSSSFPPHSPLPMYHSHPFTEPFQNLDKYILEFRQIHFAIWTNTFCNLYVAASLLPCIIHPFMEPSLATAAGAKNAQVFKLTKGRLVFTIIKGMFAKRKLLFGQTFGTFSIELLVCHQNINCAVHNVHVCWATSTQQGTPV